MKKVLIGLVIALMMTGGGYAKNFEERENQELIVIFEVSYTEDIEVIEKYLIDEEVPFIYGVNRNNLTRFEWFFNPNQKTATLIEVSNSSDAWEDTVLGPAGGSTVLLLGTFCGSLLLLFNPGFHGDVFSLSKGCA